MDVVLELHWDRNACRLLTLRGDGVALSFSDILGIVSPGR